MAVSDKHQSVRLHKHDSGHSSSLPVKEIWKDCHAWLHWWLGGRSRSSPLLHVKIRFGRSAHLLPDITYLAHAFPLGYVECLQKEIAQFGIQAIIFEPGYYRTQIFSAQNCKVSPPTHEDYNDLFAAMVAGVGAVDGNQRGDPVKCVERMIDVVKSEGMAVGRPMPKRLPLGADSMEIMRTKCLETLKMCDDWKDVICSTDLEPEKGEANREQGQYHVTA